MQTRTDVLPPIGHFPLSEYRKLEFAYDLQGRRISKKVSNWTGTAWQLASSTLFLYDGWNLLAELNAMSANTPLRTYVWSLDLSGSLQGAGGVGGLLLSTLNPQLSTFASAYDGNGNVIAYVDMSSGATSAAYEYSAFGETLISDGGARGQLPFRFSTKYTDTESALLYYGLRYYSPATGRWLSRDPIEEKGGVNLYGTVGNDPISVYDPFGADFIAVADRQVKGLPGAYHYSAEYWICSCPVTLNTEWTVADFKKAYPSAQKQAGVELLRDDENWNIKRPTGKVVAASISVIHYSDSAVNIAPVFSGTPDEVRDKWAQIIQLSRSYRFAEQEGFAASVNWPNSFYEVGNDVNNSNTFIRYILRRSGAGMHEMGSNHPGRDVPLPVADEYNGNKPYKK